MKSELTNVPANNHLRERPRIVRVLRQQREPRRRQLFQRRFYQGADGGGDTRRLGAQETRHRKEAESVVMVGGSSNLVVAATSGSTPRRDVAVKSICSNFTQKSHVYHSSVTAHASSRAIETPSD